MVCVKFPAQFTGRFPNGGKYSIIILVKLSGRSDKDLDFVAERCGYGPDFLEKMAKRRR